ncbi:MAG: tetratricopeptide repeat protein [Acidobacteriota bacterium]
MSPLERGLLVVVALAALLAAATTLTAYYHAARHGFAQEHFDEGRALLAAGDRARGIVELRAAVSLDRSNAAFALLLAEALLADGRAKESQTHLDDAMRADPTSGPANLLRARVERALGDDRADMFYQRAFFGSWPAEALGERLETGFTLAGYLLDKGDRERARATLAQLTAEAGSDPARALRIANLLTLAGAPTDAVPLARRGVDADPRNPTAWGILAEATYGAGDDLAAQRAAATAARLDRDNPRWPHLAYVTGRTLALDPTRPRLRFAERQRRARGLLELVMADAVQCAGAGVSEPKEGSQADAKALLSRGDRDRLEGEPFLELALRLWQDRPPECTTQGPDHEALSRVLARLVREPVEP